MIVLWIVACITAGALVYAATHRGGSRRDVKTRNTEPTMIVPKPNRGHWVPPTLEADPDAFYADENEMAVWGDEGTDDE